MFEGGGVGTRSSVRGMVGMSLGRDDAKAAGLAGDEDAGVPVGIGLSDRVEMELYPALKLTDPTLTFLLLLPSPSHTEVSYTSVMLSRRLESSSKTLLRDNNLCTMAEG